MERLLWAELRNRKLDGVKYRRQHPVESFVLDFYAPEFRLVIELDGDVHDIPERHHADQRRQRRLEALGMRVLRFTNLELTQDPDAVLNRIRSEVADARQNK